MTRLDTPTIVALIVLCLLLALIACRQLAPPNPRVVQRQEQEALAPRRLPKPAKMQTPDRTIGISVR